MRWTAWISVWLALVAASLASLAVVWGLWWSGAEDAVASALADHLVSEAALVGEHLREVPVDVLAGLGAGHASDAVTAEHHPRRARKLSCARRKGTCAPTWAERGFRA